MPQPQTIQIFLPFGEPRGVRLADITTRIALVVVVPRAKLSSVDRPELRRVGLYMLFGDSEDGGLPSVYIGEAEDCLVRLKQHNLSKEFWTTAVVVVSKTQNLTKSHARYLEWLAIGKAKEAGRYLLENNTSPKKPFVTESQEAELLEVFVNAATLTAALGFPAFEPLATEAEASQDHFFYAPMSAAASGKLTDDGFVVFAGSTASAEEKPSTGAWVSKLRNALLASGILEADGLLLRFTTDYLFNSPSAAGVVVRGHNVNGWEAWKNESGRTLDEVFRNEAQ